MGLYYYFYNTQTPKKKGNLCKNLAIMKQFVLYAFCLLILVGCANSDKNAKQGDAKATEATEGKAINTLVEGTMTKNGLQLIPVQSPAFDDAKLILRSPRGRLPGGKTKFQFGVSNYELGNQTPGAKDKMCANSAKGQHIHFLLNNEPYKALYEPDYMTNLAEGHHVVLGFLSRSYHESIKTPDAHVLTEFTAGKPSQASTFDAKAPHLFYSRPKGEYIGKANIEQVMLDFYLTNTSLSAKGNKVKATINGTEFMISNWQPYFIKGLPEGETTIKLALVDNKGSLIPGPFNEVTRTIKLFAEEPLIEKN